MIKVPLFSKPGVIKNPFLGSLTQAWGTLIPYLFLVIPIFKLLGNLQISQIILVIIALLKQLEAINLVDVHLFQIKLRTNFFEKFGFFKISHGFFFIILIINDPGITFIHIQMK